MRKITKAAALALGGIALALSGPGIASAATATPTATTGVPSCVVDVYGDNFAQVTNNCSTTQRVETSIWFGYNECWVLQPGETRTTNESIMGHFALRTC
ncbi:hypothetical protein [Kitasatospora aureofaciens]|uniref:hypothetical protein n=1 Tax=Kitasatospora aureofaciens TaxID=1894 RepID=UPI001C438F4E|nr:hypothetical protein [Kitasatospora aureofaciens]MBV6696031.1 hypothetical protein [Kitasatospora aureofaciens]